jgi:hypothetical protein
MRTLLVFTCASVVTLVSVSPVLIHDLGHTVTAIHAHEHDDDAHAHEHEHGRDDTHHDLTLVSLPAFVAQSSIPIVLAPACLDAIVTANTVNSNIHPIPRRAAPYKDPPHALVQLLYHSAQANKAPPV